MLVRGFHFLPIVFSFLLSVHVAQAEPIITGSLRITSGSISLFPGFDFGEEAPIEGFFLSGPGFSLAIGAGVECNDCLRERLPLRTPFDISYTYAPPPTLFDNVRVETASARLEDPANLQLRFISPVQPRIPMPSPDGRISFEAAFRMTGAISGRDFETGQLFRFGLEGQGETILEGFLIPEFPGTFFTFNQAWSFAPAAPIPEPSTILLLSAGAIAALKERKRLRT